MTSDPRDPRVRIALGVLLCLVAGFVARTIVGPPPFAARRINRAIELAGAGDRQGAYEMLQTVVVERPEDADAWMRTGKALTALGRPFDAAVYLEKAAELDSTSSIIQIERVNALIRAQLYDDAQEAVDAALARRPGEGGLLYLAAALAGRRGDAENAARLFRLAVEHGAYRPDRFRRETLFDPVRNAPVFLQAVYETRVPGSFVEERS